MMQVVGQSCGRCKEQLLFFAAALTLCSDGIRRVLLARQYSHFE